MNDKRISLYPVGGINISDLLREAHPQGGPIIGGDKEGKVEDSIEAQIKNLESFYKKPAVITLAQLAERLEAVGATDLAEQIDKVASGLFHKSALVKKSSVPVDTEVVVKALDGFIKYMNGFKTRNLENHLIFDAGKQSAIWCEEYKKALFNDSITPIDIFRKYRFLKLNLDNLMKTISDSHVDNRPDYIEPLCKKTIEIVEQFNKKMLLEIKGMSQYYKSEMTKIKKSIDSIQLLAERKAATNSLDISDSLEDKVNSILSKYSDKVKNFKHAYDVVMSQGDQYFTDAIMSRLNTIVFDMESSMANLQKELWELT